MEEKILILSHLGLGDNIFCISMINYYLKNNFIVHYICKKHNLINFQLFFDKNKNLKIIDVKNDKEAHLFIKNNEKNYKNILKSGVHSKNSKLYNFPFFQYDDIGLERNILKNYFTIPETLNSKKLYILVKNMKYIIINNQTSHGEKFNINTELSKYKIDINKFLIINTQKNFYNNDHKYFSLAQNFVFQKLIDYSLLLKYAEKIFITDSSMFCMATQLNLINKNHHLYLRNKKMKWDNLVSFYGNKFIISN